MGPETPDSVFGLGYWANPGDSNNISESALNSLPIRAVHV